MKLVRENINEKFTEDSDPVRDMGIGKEAMFKDLEKRVRIWFGWGDGEGEEEKKKFIENINVITDLVNELEKAGFDVSKMSITHADTISVRCIEVIDSNHVIAYCATKEDANILINAFKKFAIWDYNNFSIDEGERYVKVYSHEWLDDLIENRKKYKNIK